MADKIEGYGVGDVSDDLRAWTERVAEILNTLIATADIADGAVTYAKIQDLAALTVLGRAANSAGVVGEIAAAANDLLLRRTGDTINFGALTIGMVANSLLTYAKLQDSAGVSVLGRSANSSGVLADITAAANDRLLARTGDALSFVQLTAGMVPNSLITLAMMANLSEATIIGRAAGAGTGVPTALSASDVLSILGFNLPVVGTPVATTSGTSVDISTSIPSWARKLTLTFSGVSTSGTSLPLIQVGSSGGYETTSYTSSCTNITDTGSVSVASSTAGFVINSNIATNTLFGTVILSLHSSSTNDWKLSGAMHRGDADRSLVLSGSKALSAALDRIRITTVGGVNTFDAGSVTLRYEY